MELCGWTSPQMLRRYGASARARRMLTASLPTPDTGRDQPARHDIPVSREGSGLAGFAAGDPQSDFETGPV